MKVNPLMVWGDACNTCPGESWAGRGVGRWRGHDGQQRMLAR